MSVSVKKKHILECYKFFDVKNIKIGFTNLEIWIFVIKSKKSVFFDLKRPNNKGKNLTDGDKNIEHFFKIP